MTPASALYFGSVFHRRLGAVPHRFRYRLFWLFVDLDELNDCGRRLRLFSHNRFNLFSLHDRDHGDGSARALREQAAALIRESGIGEEIGAIRLFCMPRTLGYAFNPLSVYFCYARDGGLAALIYEVHNTFGGRHSYVMPAKTSGAVARQACDKSFFVSPFLPMGLRYEFQVSPPGESIAITIRAVGPDGPALRAALIGQRQSLTDRSLMRAAVYAPFVAMKTIAAIHWQALRLIMKGAVYRGPRTNAGGKPVADRALGTS
ncbi:DUF1365 domain-containing protein [Roseiarcus sp.]|uniref:DUF1365 domain-containing protein n=1 Tax=Roseiarcus sp. TaxID=1969460 RepID=UPI003F961E99